MRLALTDSPSHQDSQITLKYIHSLHKTFKHLCQDLEHSFRIIKESFSRLIAPKFE